jgi:cyclophilin family peptidyl-prolyl cis-trans isomerase
MTQRFTHQRARSGPIRSLFRRTLLALAVTAGCGHRGQSVAQTAPPNVLADPDADYWHSSAPALFYARVETTKGTFTLEIERRLAPLGVDRFFNLARAGFFDDSRFTRVVPNFIAQFGVPKDPALRAWYMRTFPDDSVRASNVRGTIAFAMTGPNARTTQLFISLVDNSRLDAQGFAPIGRVIDGMDVVDRLYSGYGETSGGGVRAGNQAPLLAGGNAYVDREFPKLDRLLRIRISDRK